MESFIQYSLILLLSIIISLPFFFCWGKKLNSNSFYRAFLLIFLIMHITMWWSLNALWAKLYQTTWRNALLTNISLGLKLSPMYFLESTPLMDLINIASVWLSTVLYYCHILICIFDQKYEQTRVWSSPFYRMSIYLTIFM